MGRRGGNVSQEKVQKRVRDADHEGVNYFEDEEVKQSIVHTREDVVTLVCHLIVCESTITEHHDTPIRCGIRFGISCGRSFLLRSKVNNLMILGDTKSNVSVSGNRRGKIV